MYMWLDYYTSLRVWPCAMHMCGNNMLLSFCLQAARGFRYLMTCNLCRGAHACQKVHTYYKRNATIGTHNTQSRAQQSPCKRDGASGDRRRASETEREIKWLIYRVIAHVFRSLWSQRTTHRAPQTWSTWWQNRLWRLCGVAQNMRSACAYKLCSLLSYAPMFGCDRTKIGWWVVA